VRSSKQLLQVDAVIVSSIPSTWPTFVLFVMVIYMYTAGYAVSHCSLSRISTGLLYNIH